MNSIITAKKRFKTQKSSSKRGISTALLMAVLLIVALGLGFGLASASAAATQALNNVQIQVQTSGSSANISSYSLTVYNSTGYPIVSSNSAYPGFGAMLPSGTYLFTVMAIQSYSYCCPVPMGVASSGVSTAGAPNTGGSSSSSASPSVAMPIKYAPAEEYGYAMKQISGPTSLTISTSSLYNITTSKVAVHVSYANGTAASGAYVSASLIGAWYYYGGETNNWVMWGQTGADGSFTLVVPNLPVEVYAYSSIQVDIPKSQVTYQTTIGGEKVNVTVYWQPMYVYLEGYSLVFPPQSSTNITLHVQQPNYYYATPYDAAKSNVGQAPLGAPTSQTAPTNASGGSLQQSQTTQPQTIPPFSGGGNAVTTQTVAGPTITQYTTGASSSSSTLVQLLSAAVIISVALSAFSIIFAIRRKPAA